MIDNIQYARRVARIWKALREFLSDPEIEVSGRLTLTQENGQRCIKWRGVDDISKQFRVPTLMLDATLPELPILRAYHPQVTIVATIKIEMPPPVRVRQVLDAPTSAYKLIHGGEREKHLDEVYRYILKRWYETGKGETLVVCQLEVEKWFEGKLPPGIALEHFNAVTGLDRHREVRLQILIGRVAPGPEAVETLSAALSARQPMTIPRDPQGGFHWFRPPVARHITRPDGSGHTVDRCDMHPDPFGEKVRWLVCEGELIQAIGRSRGVNRTPDTPLDIDIVSNVVTPFTIHEIEYRKRKVEMASLFFKTAPEGVMLTSRVDMVKVWPHIWDNDTAAKRTLATGVPTLPGFVSVTYQPVGPKMKRRQGWFDLSVIPDPKAWLTAHLGPLAFFASAPL
jgi:hypothetical protein